MNHVPGVLLALALVNVGCINTDAAVFVEASIENPTMSVTQSSLVTGVAGNFGLSLHLGPRASGASEVGLGVFKVLGSDRVSTIVPTLGATTSLSFPIRVDLDSTVNVAATFIAKDNPLEASAIDSLCAPGGVVISATLNDSLRGGSITVTSTAITPTGCP